MSTRKYYTEELNEYASEHTMKECSMHYNINIGGIYSLFKKYGIKYKHVEIKSGKHKETEKKNKSFYIAKWMGDLRPLTKQDGWYMLAISVLAYAKIDDCSEFPTKELFIEAVDIKDYMHCEIDNKIRRNGILI
jgi:hypothetical protein